MSDSGADRRAGERFNAELDIEWESPSGRFSGVLSDISLTGCFVLCAESVEDAQPIRLFVFVDDSMETEFVGEVVNSTPDIGFAMRFHSVSDVHKELIAKLIYQQ